MALNRYSGEHSILTQSKLFKWPTFGSQGEIQHTFLSTFTIGMNKKDCPTLVSRKEEMIPNGRTSRASTSCDIDKQRHCVIIHAHDRKLFPKLLLLLTHKMYSSIYPLLGG